MRWISRIVWTVWVVLGPDLGWGAEPLILVLRGPERVRMEDVLGAHPVSLGFEAWVVNPGPQEWRVGTTRYSDYWRVVVEGPSLDPRCRGRRDGNIIICFAGFPTDRLAPGQKELDSILEWGGIVGPGRYRMWLEYDGTEIPEDAERLQDEVEHKKGPPFLRMHLKSKPIEFEVLPLRGVDAEMVARWQKWNPGRPLCEFPGGIASEGGVKDKKDILEDAVWILNRYPRSRYAAWLRYRPLPLEGDETEEQIENLIRLHIREAQAVYGLETPTTGVSIDGVNGCEVFWTVDETGVVKKEPAYLKHQACWAWWLREAEAILGFQPDFPRRRQVELVRALQWLYLKEMEKGLQEMERLAWGTDWVAEWAGRFLEVFRQEVWGRLYPGRPFPYAPRTP